MHILVVDDEAQFGQLLGRLLLRLGHAATIACHPTDALELLRTHSFDAVITDIDMPVMDGVELARTIKSENPEMPIAFCTGSGPENNAAAAEIGQVLPKVHCEQQLREVLLGLGIQSRG